MNLNGQSPETSTDGAPTKPSLGPRRKTGFSKRPGVAKENGVEDRVDGADDDDDFEEEEWVPDVFLFEYGTVVIWGMTEKEEKAFLRSL